MEATISKDVNRLGARLGKLAEPGDRFFNRRFNAKANIQDYYTEAGQDYEAWSKDFNMHFGLAVKPFDCLSREAMLKQMNDRVFEELGLNSLHEGRVYDMGCGLGATLRQGAKKYPRLDFRGATIVDWQVEQSRGFIRREQLQNAWVDQNDYTNTDFESNSADAVYFIESMCHADGLDKGAPLREAYRVLKPGQTIVITDGMVRDNPVNFGPFLHKLYRLVCNNWALEDFAHIDLLRERMEEVGFKDIEIKEEGWKVAPSAVHAPFLTTWFFLKKMVKGEEITKQGINNLKACFGAFFLGLFRSKFGYYVIKAKK